MVAFRSLISSLIQSERFGTSLTDTLRVLSEDFRLQRLSVAEAKAARLPVLMTIPLIFLLMPAFFLIVLGPAIVKVMNNGQEITGR
jgi:tight adherence protein C